jgi:hypothetical protein
MTTYKELAERLEETMHDDAGFHLAVDEAIEILRSLDAQKPIGYWGGAFSIEGGADLYEVEQVSAFGRVYKNLPLYAAPVAAQPPSQPVDPVHVINTAIDVMMRRDATIAGVLFDFMGWLTTRKERLCLSSADDASPAVTAITEFAKMRNLSLDNAMVTDWQSGAAQASKPLSDEPNMFWNHDDPESPYGSIDEFLNDEWCQTGLAVGDIRRVQRAIRLPDVMVRVTAVSGDGDIDYIVEPVGGIKERG